MQYVCQFIAHNKANYRHPICLYFSPADTCSHNPFIFMQPPLFHYITSSASCCHFTPFPLCSPSQTEPTMNYRHFVIARWAHTEIMEHTGRKENPTLEFLHVFCLPGGVPWTQHQTFRVAFTMSRAYLWLCISCPICDYKQLDLNLSGGRSTSLLLFYTPL